MVHQPNHPRADHAGASSASQADLDLWDDAHRNQRIQVFGAGGAVGRELVAALLRARHPLQKLELYARQPRTMIWRDQELEFRRITSAVGAADLAFLCTPPDLARRLAPAVGGLGTRVIDLSGGHRWRRDVPMVEPGIRMESLGAFTQLVTLPGRTTALIAQPLWALERAAGLKEVSLVVLRSSAAEGARGILELRHELEQHPEPVNRIVSHLAGNLIPSAGESLLQGGCAAEGELVWDLRQLFARPQLAVDVQAVRVGVERCDGFAVNLLLQRPLTPQGAAQALAAQGLEVDTTGLGPTPLDCVGSDRVHVGRIRTGSRGPASLCFFAVGDQLRFGAAVAALQVAASLPPCS